MAELNKDIEDGQDRGGSEKSLARRLLVWVLGLYFLVAVVSTAVLLFFQYQREKSNLLGVLYQVETLLASNFAAAVWDFNTVQLVVGARSVLEVPMLSGIRIEDATGELLFQAGEVISPDGVAVLLNDNGKPVKELEPGTLIEHAFALNRQEEKRILTVGRAQVFANSRYLVKALRASLLVTVMTALLQATAVALMLTLALSRGLRQPLQRLMEQLDQIDFSSSDLPRISRGGLEGAELVRLQRTLNSALERIDEGRLALEGKNRDLDELNQNLEQTVEERTADLTAAYAQVNKELADRKLAEKALIIAKQDAEAASEAKSLFINNMSHELRTPLSGIIVSTDLALGQELSPKVEKNLKTIRRSGRALLGTVNTILDFSKSENGKLELVAIPFRLDEVLGKLSGTFVQKGAQKQIKISFDIAADEVSNALIGDPDRLLDVFNHLLDNAAKFSTGIPKAAIGVRDVDTSAKKTTLEFYVKDNGIGIASEDFEKIFDAFTQADTSSTRQYDGTGMGLAASKRLVERMGGTIRVESELGKGSTFYFTASFDRQGQEHPFKVPSFKDREDTTVDRMNSKTCGKMGSPKLLLELLSTIDPFIQKRKPKLCKEVMGEINGYSWPDEYAQEIVELDRLIGKYKFKDAYTIFESIVEKLKTSIS
jgi:signal transduction histidine kinase